MKLLFILSSFFLMYQANAQTTLDSKFPVKSGYYSSFEQNYIQQPVLIIRGDKDKYNTTSRELAHILPNGTFEETPGDHDHAVTTSVFPKKVRTFLKRYNY